MSNATWAVILIPLLAVMTGVGSFGVKKPSTVVLLHNGVWAGALFLIGTDLVRYKESSTEAWLTLSLGLVFFNLGSLLSRLSDQGLSTWSANGETKICALLSRRALFWAVAMYGGAFCYYLLMIQQRYGLTTLLTDPESIRAYSAVSYLQSIPLPVRILLYLGPVLFVVFGFREALDKPFPMVVRLFAMALLATSMLALLQRTNLFMGILWLVAMLITRESSILGGVRDRTIPELKAGAPPSRMSRTAVTVSIVFLVLSSLLAFQVVAGFLNKNGQQALSAGTVSTELQSSGLTSPFIYYTGGTIAFLQLTDSQNASWPPPFRPDAMAIGDYNPQTWGAATLSPVLKALPVVRPWNPIAPFIDTGVLTNVYTWLEPFYRDFRIPGVVVAMLLMGWIATRLHDRRFQSPRMFWLQGAVLSSVFLAPFVTKVVDTLFITELIFIVLLTRNSRPKSRSFARTARQSLR
ncbi:oligosaccharide repeat unit polymerase [Cryobacterium sp. TMT1-19]|uniref:O-antigen polymerase n=1 Tax=Cryobacterium sp. TMT1-19 TaxID=1259231 RepID=UPI00106CF5D5|nr:O-antigen polymerase [Cryobacterium sp. TMT1-19]TFD37920.1 oligosaccharide repeat unit polymerase [Cryobacterium sp. TMT1-19]